MAQSLGIIDIQWKGTKLDVEPGGKLLLGGMQNKGVTTGQKRKFAREFKESIITATRTFDRGMSASDLYDPDAGELQVHCDTGQIFTFPDAFMTERPELTAGDGGKAECKWEAGQYEEIVS
ncbi:phage tail tube protein [Ancylobacter defluvii]|uniref:Tail tube protein n=1 Tax=Ancylobacter defluvii TaxID=1282440 RepID=A0A9W6K003_9HYPH|nr:phage tail tube protein [Ancylobacter defluvii]MBS7586405.1 phage tail tube protein [Ancylobacter defluvii]GLK85686.1 hypothetical protein GCM10017653_37560 [Ancylobacter defluvii]